MGPTRWRRGPGEPQIPGSPLERLPGSASSGWTVMKIVFLIPAGVREPRRGVSLGEAHGKKPRGHYA